MFSKKLDVVLYLILSFLVVIGVGSAIIYISDSDRNYHYIPTICNITRYDLVNTIINCYDGYIFVNHTTKNNTEVTGEIVVTPEDDTYNNTLYFLEKNYPIGTEINCWYSDHNPAKIILVVFDTTISLSVAISCFSVSFIIVTIQVIRFICERYKRHEYKDIL
jgi:hypothetical protein